MIGSRARTSRRPILPPTTLLLVAASVAMIASGCGRGKVSSPVGSAKIKICYLGLTCEPAIFVAYEKGFFKEEGLDVELIKSDWGSIRDGLADGRFHATYTLSMYL